MTHPTRTVHCADATSWLAGHALPDDSAIVTSLPDVSEFRHGDAQRWRSWFVDAARLVLRCTPPTRAAIFYQTDVKRDGCWIDKAFLVQQAAEAEAIALLWHKVVCRAPAGQATFGRPGYAHLLCFSQTLRDAVDDATADVLPELGAMTWSRAIGLEPARAAVSWLQQHAGARTIVDPFCGVGTVLAVANREGLDAIGIELNSGRAEQARTLTL